MPEALNGFAVHFPRYGLLFICHGIVYLSRYSLLFICHGVVCCLFVTIWLVVHLLRSGFVVHHQCHDPVCCSFVTIWFVVHFVTIWFVGHLSRSGLSLIYHDLVCCSLVTIWFAVHLSRSGLLFTLSRSDLLFVQSLSARVMAIWTLEWIRLCDMIIHCRPVHYILIPGQFIVFILGQFIMF